MKTILVPAEQVDVLRAALLASHGDLVDEIARLERRPGSGGEAASEGRARLRQIERVLEQVGWTAEGEPVPGARRVTGSRAVLWSAVYDTVCGATEQLAELCAGYWEGGISPAEIHAGIAEVAARFGLLEALGEPVGT